ncbi:MAG TPA: DUF2877 domain-containing protein [Nitrososphaerales archaeon]|nr:DUF2877 domain-containing protein [Nitrososphaerales archaeon]
MSLRASHIGELAVKVLRRGKPGKVTRVFGSSAYLRSGSDFVLVLWGALRSPMTINISEGRDGEEVFRVGDEWAFAGSGIRLGSKTIDVRGASVYSSGLRDRKPIVLPPPVQLAKGAAMLKSMYDVSKFEPALVDDVELRTFVERTLVPFAGGKQGVLYDVPRYLPLIGRGGGFTPAGDDFVAGFLAAFNYIARSRRSKQILTPRGLLLSGTVPESAAILGYAARGFVDEVLERLLLASLGEERESFRNELLEMARRGHTSGIDISLGVLLCEAALSDTEGRPALRGCLDAIWNT